MVGNNDTVFFEFAINEMLAHGDEIRKWAQQTDNLLLKQLASEVIEAAGEQP